MKTHKYTPPTWLLTAARAGRVSLVHVRMRPLPPTWAEYPSTAPYGKDTFIHWTDGASEEYRCWPSDEPIRIPYRAGDRLAMLESFKLRHWTIPGDWAYLIDGEDETNSKLFGGWEPASRMPLAACRCFLRITAVRAVRMREVTEEQAIAAGCESCTPADELRMRWNAQRGHNWSCDWAWELAVEPGGAR